MMPLTKRQRVFKREMDGWDENTCPHPNQDARKGSKTLKKSHKAQPKIKTRPKGP